jgi:serine/threonine-protein kinase
MLAGRYRIFGLLGKGGMGEVYRADDIKLGQPVALKFLPKALEQNQERLNRFLNEVKTARHVSHPNVCRVYDVGEHEGQHFLSMEYVDGEDLASLLRRIGRLPEDKAVQIARQLCAGLGASHEQGVLHRDMKPANVMIDGRGRVRITDFGLADLTESIGKDASRAGTPGYMAPEQLQGEAVTPRSDIYSLGLVLYELFTGRPAFEAETLRDITRMQLETAPTSPSSHVSGMDPAVERAILRCLEKDPSDRPASALAVAASLPGADPLAAALMAGETPSPEMIAAAGPRGGMKPGIAIACVVVILLGFVAGAIAIRKSFLLPRVPFAKSFAGLKENAREIASRLGYTDVNDTAAWYRTKMDRFLRLSLEGETGLALLDSPEQPVIDMVYRQSSDSIVPESFTAGVTPDDPPPGPGDVVLALDLEGRLLYLRAPPPRREPGDEATEPDWPALFAAAGLDIEAFDPASPTVQPPDFADTRQAWTGTLPGPDERPVRIEAAAFRGKPVYFSKITPTHPYWSAEEGQTAPELPEGVFLAFAIFIVTVLLLLGGGAVFLALRNLKLGRGDRQGAMRIATFLFAARLLYWLLAGHHVAGLGEAGLFIVVLTGAIALGALAWVLYMAIEPYARRLWPRSMVSWSRLLAGRLRDPLVGRDLLIGFTANALGIVVLIPWWIAMARGEMLPLPDTNPLLAVQGGRFVLGQLFGMALVNFPFPLGFVALFLLLRIVGRRTWVAAILVCLIFAAQATLQFTVLSGGRASAVLLLLGAAFGVMQAAYFLFLFIRFGLLAMMAASVFGGIGQYYGMPLDPSAPYFGAALFGLLLMLALVAYAFWVSLAGQRVFSDAILDAPAPSHADR